MKYGSASSLKVKIISATATEAVAWRGITQTLAPRPALMRGESMPYDPALDGETAVIDRAHEAGHAVISVIEGHRFLHIDMQQVNDSNAHVEPIRFPGNDIYPFGFNPEEAGRSALVRDRLRRQLHILLAGGEADRLAVPGHIQNTDGIDLDKARQLLALARTSDPTLAAELGAYAEEAKQLVATHWAAIDQVAAELRNCRELSFEEVCALVLPEAATWEYEVNGWRVADQADRSNGR
jgi:hypothetical protein